MKKIIPVKKINIKQKPSIKDWTNLILPANKKADKIDAQKILIEMRYGRNASN
jgi:hypothetical protein